MNGIELKKLVNRMVKPTHDRIVIIYQDHVIYSNATEAQCRAIQVLVAEGKLDCNDIIIREYSSKIKGPFVNEIHMNDLGYTTEDFIGNLYTLNSDFILRVMVANAASK